MNTDATRRRDRRRSAPTARPDTTGSAGRTRRTGRARPRGGRAFTAALAVVVAALAVLGLGGAAITTMQGPRVTAVQFDEAAAVSAAGSRIIFTTTQSLRDVDPAQVTVEPAADFTVDTSGRSVGVRFALPLWDATTYTIRISDVEGIGGGPAATIEKTVTTPGLTVSLLERGSDDGVFRSGLDGEESRVFTHDHIEDFRETARHLVFATVDADDESRLIVTDRRGHDARELPLPGNGHVTNLQSADRGDVIGFTYTDADIDEDSGIESGLFTISLTDRAAKPTQVTLATGESRVEDWRFVPGTDSILMLTFDGALTLASSVGADPVALGNAMSIDGIARGSTRAFVETVDGPTAIDLVTAEQVPIAATAPESGQIVSITPLPGDDTATLRVLARFDGLDVVGTDVDRVDDAGNAETVFQVDPDDTLLQTCVSPSGRYAAFLVAPDAVDNPYDGYLLPLPERLRTHIVQLRDGAEVTTLNGFDISWCQSAPRV